ncbi:arsenical-resistance protein [Epithele typhae]|uniref:arsenical-resistance protein n=1 Tax=Epithele typhae TaxID=378194 RepID=UPI0020083A9C|nr:arsenical-resistance protein [Epithele typhae]KAH9913903.1 arsenical-resistance protein [Epithele typhae]
MDHFGKGDSITTDPPSQENVEKSDLRASPVDSQVDADTAAPSALMKKLGILDRLLSPAILICMVVGVLIGNFVPGVQEAFDTARFQSVSAPIATGLLVMMWPILTKVRYESLPALLPTRTMAVHIALSLALNWLVAPFVMLALAWAALPDLPTYRTGVIMVGLARCIAMVVVALQVVLYAPLSLLFVNVLGGGGGVEETLHVSYKDVAISVLIVRVFCLLDPILVIADGARAAVPRHPALCGIVTRFVVLKTTSRAFLESRFLPWFSPLAFIGLLYTIVVMFAYQGHHIVHNLGPVFRVFVPLVLYFALMWSAAFAFVWWCGRRARRRQVAGAAGPAGGGVEWSYEMAVVQSFTAASNNFELAIAVTIAVYGVGSDQALAATIGPLVEVPVLLGLTWVALFLKRKLKWSERMQGSAA